MFGLSDNWAIKLLLSVMAVFAPIKAVLATVLCLVLVDLITGCMAAYKRGEQITSAGLGRTVLKIFLYEIAIMFGYLAEHYLTGPLLPMSNIISSFISLNECTSVLENLNQISGDNLFKKLLNSLKSGSGKWKIPKVQYKKIKKPSHRKPRKR